jgi:hypothetical protein
MNKVVVTLEGGLVTSVISSDMDTEVLVVDYDSEGADKDEIISQEEVDTFIDGENMYTVDHKGGVAEGSLDFNVVE